MATGFTKNDARLGFDEATHSYTLGGLRFTSVTQALGLVGIADFSAPWFDEVVKAKGSALHEAIRLDVNGQLDEASIDAETQGGVEGWRRFVADTRAVIEFAEQALCDPDHHVAGRLDYIVTMTQANGRTVRMLIDVKRALYPSAAVQTAAYADMAYALYDQPVLLQRGALVLPGDGSYTLYPFTDPLDRTLWQAAVHILNFRRRHGIH